MAARRRKDLPPSFLAEDLAAARRALLSAQLPLVPIVGRPIELLVSCPWRTRHGLVYVQATVLNVVVEGDVEGDSDPVVVTIHISLSELDGRTVHELIAGEPAPVRWHLVCTDADGTRHRLAAHIIAL